MAMQVLARILGSLDLDWPQRDIRDIFRNCGVADLTEQIETIFWAIRRVATLGLLIN